MEGRIAGVLVLGAVLVLLAPSAAATITVYTDRASFEANTGPLVEVDFEDLNSVVLQGMRFRDPLRLEVGFCATPTCPPDPDNPSGGDIVLPLNVGGDVRFPAEVAWVTLVVAGMGDTTFTLEVTDGAGGTFTVDGQGIPWDDASVDLASPEGIAEARVARTDAGPLVLSSVVARDAAGSVLADEDFEAMPLYAPCILSVCTETTIPGQPLVPNPLTTAGVTFADPVRLGLGFCSAPTCQVDPDNPLGNLVLFLDAGGTIDFPAGTGGVLLVLEGIGDNTFTVRAVAFDGETMDASHQGVLYGVGVLGFDSPAGIATLEVVSVGGSGGPLSVSAVVFEPDGNPSVDPPPVAKPPLRPPRESPGDPFPPGAADEPGDPTGVPAKSRSCPWVASLAVLVSVGVLIAGGTGAVLWRRRRH